MELSSQNTSPALPFDYCHRWIREAFRMAEKHYKLFALLGLFVFASELIISFVPYFGALAVAPLRFVFALNSLRMMHSLFQQQEQTVESFFEMCMDQKLLLKFKNYLIASAGIGLVIEIGQYFGIPHFYIASALLTVTLLLIPFMAYLQHRQPQLSEQEAMNFVFSQTWKNVGLLLAHAILLLCVGLTALALCVVPFFIYFLPLTFPLTYLIYMGLCENKTIEELAQNWNSPVTSPAVE